MEPTENQLKAIDTALAELNERSAEISDQRVTIEANVHATMRRLHNILNVRETELIDQLHRIIQRKLKCLSSQKEQMETIQAQLNSSLNYITDSLRSDSQGEFLRLKATIAKRVKELTTPFQPDQLKPNTECDITFSTSPDTAVICKQYGKVISLGSPDPSNSHATDEGLVRNLQLFYKLSAIMVHRVMTYELVSEITHVTSAW